MNALAQSWLLLVAALLSVGLVVLVLVIGARRTGKLLGVLLRRRRRPLAVADGRSRRRLHVEASRGPGARTDLSDEAGATEYETASDEMVSRRPVRVAPNVAAGARIDLSDGAEDAEQEAAPDEKMRERKQM